MPASLPEGVCLIVMPVERFQRGLEFDGNAQRVEHIPLTPPLLRHPLADVLPQVTKLGHIVAGDIVGHRHAGQLDDPALDGIHQREVAHSPREESALGITRSAQEKWSRRQVNDPVQAQLAVNDLQTGNPDPRGLVVLFGFLLLVAGQIHFFLHGLFAVAVMRLVVKHHDVFQPHQAGHHALQHLPFRFQRIKRLAVPLKERSTTFRQFHTLTKHEGVVVGNDDFCAIDVAQHIARNELPALVIAVRVVGLKHTQPIANGQAGRNDQEPSRKSLAVGTAHRIDGLPGDQHRHDSGFTGAGGQLQRQPKQFGIGIMVSVGQMLDKPFSIGRSRSNLHEPDGGFDGFNLAKEGPDAVEVVVTPVLQQEGRLGCDLPLSGIRKAAPLVHLTCAVH